MAIPEGWTETSLDQILHEDQIRDLQKWHEEGSLTQAKIKELVYRHTDKMNDVVVPQFLVYALMHKFGVYE